MTVLLLLESPAFCADDGWFDPGDVATPTIGTISDGVVSALAPRAVVLMGLRSKESTRTCNTLGVRKAGNDGPRRMPRMPRWSSDSSTTIAFCSYQLMISDNGKFGKDKCFDPLDQPTTIRSLLKLLSERGPVGVISTSSSMRTPP